MNIIEIDIKLSDANKNLIDPKLTKYANDIKVTFDIKSKEFRTSSYLILSNNKVSDRYFKTSSTYFDRQF